MGLFVDVLIGGEVHRKRGQFFFKSSHRKQEDPVSDNPKYPTLAHASHPTRPPQHTFTYAVLFVCCWWCIFDESAVASSIERHNLVKGGVTGNTGGWDEGTKGKEDDWGKEWLSVEGESDTKPVFNID